MNRSVIFPSFCQNHGGAMHCISSKQNFKQREYKCTKNPVQFPHYWHQQHQWYSWYMHANNHLLNGLVIVVTVETTWFLLSTPMYVFSFTLMMWKLTLLMVNISTHSSLHAVQVHLGCRVNWSKIAHAQMFLDIYFCSLDSFYCGMTNLMSCSLQGH